LNSIGDIAMISFYDDQVNFEANSSTTVVVTFSGFTPLDDPIDIPPEAPITINGITFTPIEPTDAKCGPNLYVAEPGGIAATNDFPVPLESNVLTESGNENIDITFSTAPTAVGFDTYTNSFDPPVVSVYNTAGNLRAQYVLSQDPDTIGFLGIVSNFPIGKVNWLATRGGEQGHDTGIANVRVG
jgi:hypothetical protein